eukprot:scaffold25_cov342-Pavlova_lutheri.AAC.50
MPCIMHTAWEKTRAVWLGPPDACYGCSIKPEIAVNCLLLVHVARCALPAAIIRSEMWELD